MNKLKPCPFCGNSNPVYWCYPKDDKHLFTDRWAVVCFYSDGGCGAEGSHQKSKAEAAEAWNKRALNFAHCKNCIYRRSDWYCTHNHHEIPNKKWYCADGRKDDA